jgi:hypothetical protein
MSLKIVGKEKNTQYYYFCYVSVMNEHKLVNMDRNHY